MPIHEALFMSGLLALLVSFVLIMWGSMEYRTVAVVSGWILSAVTVVLFLASIWVQVRV